MTDKQISVVFANTYGDCWGATIEMFGVADNEDDLKKICDFVESEGYFPQVETIPLNKTCQSYLGGYYE